MERYASMAYFSFSQDRNFNNVKILSDETIMINKLSHRGMIIFMGVLLGN
jgi:hypothetical protein